MSQLLGDAACGSHVDLRLRGAADHHLGDESVDEPVEDPLTVTDRFGDLDELVCERDAFRDSVDGDDCRSTALQGIREGSLVMTTAGEIDRLSAQRVTASRRVLVAQCSCEPCKKADA